MYSDISVTRRGILHGIRVATYGGALLALDACSNGNKPVTTPSKVEKARVVTGFGTAPRETYLFVGKGAGIFANAEIDVDVQPGQPSDANLKTLVAGKCDFACIDYVSLIRGAKTYPNVRAVAAIQKDTLLSMIALPGKGISTPKDLAGKTLGTAPAAASQTLFPSYAKEAGLDPKSVKFVPFPSDQLPVMLATNKIDAMGAYAIDTPGISNAAGGALLVVLNYSKYVTDLYGTVLITTTEMIARNPDLVQRFTNAALMSANYAVFNTDEAGRLAHQAVPTVDPGIMSVTMELMRPWLGNGSLDPTKVMKGIALLEQAGMAESGLQPNDVADFRFVKAA